MAKKSAHGLRVNKVQRRGKGVSVTFSCSCGSYTGDVTSARTEVMARAQAAMHVDTHRLMTSTGGSALDVAIAKALG